MSITQERLYATVCAGQAVVARYIELCEMIRFRAEQVVKGNMTTEMFFIDLQAAISTPRRDTAVEANLFEIEALKWHYTHKRNEANKVRLRYSRAGQPYSKARGDEAYPEGARLRPRPSLQVAQGGDAPSAEALGFGSASPGPAMPSFAPVRSEPYVAVARTPTYVPSGTEYDEDTQREIDIARGLVAPGPTNDELILAEMGIAPEAKPKGLA